MAKIDGMISVPLKEESNYNQGKTGCKSETKMGPAVGHVQQGNPTKGGGINRSTMGKPQK
jgi:hypothetical protein